MSTHVAERWVPDLSTFASRLAVVRHRMGWNVKEAAMACGLPAQSWRNWEAGRRPHDVVEVAQVISMHTGVDDVWLLRGAVPTTYPGSTDQYIGGSPDYAAAA